MKQSDVRRMFIQANPGVRRWGYKGLWYKCAHCGNWCGRAGGEKACIPPDMIMEVDHIRPWSQGGSDELWNLQPLCKPCNRAKSASVNAKDSMKIMKNNILHGDFIGSTVKKAARQNGILKALGITKRK